MRRKRLILYLALALAAPVPAFALGLTDSSTPAPGSLDAQASLDTCGIFEQQIVCKLDVAFNQVAGADRYSANITGPDGSVSDYGDVHPDYGTLADFQGLLQGAHDRGLKIILDEVLAHTSGRVPAAPAEPEAGAGPGSSRARSRGRSGSNSAWSPTR